MGQETVVRAWSPPVSGVAEVLHARFVDHAYPAHTHDTWTLLMVDAGEVRYDLDRRERAAGHEMVTLLPPHVPHDGRAAHATGFRKRVIYLDADQLDLGRIGAAVDHPGWVDAALHRQIARLHEALRYHGDAFEAENRLSLVRDRLARRLATGGRSPPVPDRPLARALRELLDARLVDGLTLTEAGSWLGASAAHLVRSFGAEYGIAPHRYLTGRRLDHARRMLLDGYPAVDVAVAVGFYDQAHFTRHFRRLLGVTPSAYAHS